ncbi:MAG: pilin [Patescibacteria group bacterium]
MRKINYNLLFRKFNPALAALLAVILLMPILSYAAPLVPCGTSGTPCTLCDLVQLANNLIDFMLIQLAAPLATLSIIIGGILMITAGGNESQLQRGKQIFSYAVIGFVIALGAWLIVDLILQQLLTPGSLINPLSEPVC